MLQVYADGKLLYHPLYESLAIVSPQLTLEWGKAGSFEFGLPMTNERYNDIKKLKTCITVESDGTEIFRGRVLSEESDFYNTRTIYCEGDLAYLADSVQKNERYSGSVHALFKQIVAAHNARVEAEKRFTVGRIEVEDREVLISGQSEDIQDAESGSFNYRQIVINATTNDWKNTYDYIDACIIDYCGGYLCTRRENGVTYLDLLKEGGSVSSQSLSFGVNILDLTQAATAEDLFTVLIPLGSDNLTIESVNGGSDELVDTAAVALYGRIVKTHVFPNVTQPDTLLENGQRFLQSHANIPITVSVRAVDLHLLDTQVAQIRLGDQVNVVSGPHAIDRTLVCTRIEYDFTDPANCVFTFGNPQQTLTERYRKDKNQEDKTSGGGAGGAAAEEAVKEAGDKVYDAWINVDPEVGHVSLGALYEEYQNAKLVLHNWVGIDLDAPEDNISIKDLKVKQDEHENKILDQAVQIQLINQDQEASLQLIAGRMHQLEETQVEHSAEIDLRVTDLESSISMKADRVTVDAMNASIAAHKEQLDALDKALDTTVTVELSALSKQMSSLDDRVTLSESKITALSNDVDSRITAVASRTNDTQTRVAALELRADDAESSISMKADKATLNAKVASINSDIVNINAEITNVKSLIAERIEAMQADVSWLESKYISVSAIQGDRIYATTYLSAASVKIKGEEAATQAWVKSLLADYALATHTHTWSDIQDKPTSFTPTSHRHSFAFTKTLANGHTHNVRVDGTLYTSLGVSTNSSHSLDVSGNTGYYP